MNVPSFLELFTQQKNHHPLVRTADANQRIIKLKKLKQAILAHSKDIQDALSKDLGKSPAETDLTEIFPSLAEINFTIRNLKRWMRPQKVPTPLALLGTRSRLIYEPKGLVLLIGPWNYPFQLMIVPLIAAIAAGNSVIAKPSEIASNTSQLLKKLIESLFDEKEIACVEGGPEVSQGLLKLPFDHIFFTGSTQLGKLVMKAAAENLASVTLELGGKSPVIIDPSANLEVAAQNITWGKFLNSGQTCIAPDFVMVQENLVPAFISNLKVAIQKAYGEVEGLASKPADLCRVVNQKHFERLKNLIITSLEGGSKIEMGGKWEDHSFWLSPTILSPVRFDQPIMKEEIFGPVLPIVPYKNMDEVFSNLETGPKPLALYLFSQDSQSTQNIIARLSSGGVTVNNTMIHFSNPHLPFGGIGMSGVGSYHGLFGFKALSHERAVIYQSWFNPLRLFHPPYTPRVRNLIQFAVKYLT